MTSFSLTLSPAGRHLKADAGTALRDVLFEAGVEFPCGGRGRCKGCRVKVLRGALEPTADDRTAFTSDELDQGWRLACRHTVRGNLELDLAQWDMPVLGDDGTFVFTSREGLGIAVDLGTTTIVAQLLDLKTGQIRGVETGLNAQSRHGADILSRAEYALHGGQKELEHLIREQIGAMIARLMGSTSSEALTRVVLVGNSVMHHLFCGIDITPLATYPFLPQHPEGVRIPVEALNLSGGTDVTFLPCIGGMVGADILAGIIATGLGEKEGLLALIDLGTNGEVVVSNGSRMVCTSTAAGPAFEGARISMGMRAVTGAISEVQWQSEDLTCRVIGGGEARGLCGSGLVDAVAAGLERGTIAPNGRLAAPMRLSGAVQLTPHDVRELQLAKAAIAAGLRILTEKLGTSVDKIDRLYLAGAFGNTINRASARRIGLIRLPEDRVFPSGNTALQGAKRALFNEDWNDVPAGIEYVALNEAPFFQDIFAGEMRFTTD